MKIIPLLKNDKKYSCYSYLILGDWNRIEDINTIIDPGIDDFVIDEIERLSTGFGKVPVAQIILTHNHFDHAQTSGGGSNGGATTGSSSATGTSTTNMGTSSGASSSDTASNSSNSGATSGGGSNGGATTGSSSTTGTSTTNTGSSSGASSSDTASNSSNSGQTSGGGSTGGATTGSSSTTGASSSGVSTGNLIVKLISQPAPDVPGVIVVSVPSSFTEFGKSFSIPLPEQVQNAAATHSQTIKVSMLDGQPLPSWLHYDPVSKTFVASSVTSGALPAKVAIKVGNEIWTMSINKQ